MPKRTAKTVNSTVNTTESVEPQTQTETETPAPENILEPGLHTIPLTMITKGTNIRDPKKAENVADIINSIKVNGLRTPLTVNCQGVLVDGNRRYNVLQKLQDEAPEVLEVEVLVKDIPVEEIPLYQFITMRRVNISPSEMQIAILQHYNKHPYEKQKDIAVKFDVDEKLVSRALQMNSVSKDLTKLVLDNKVSQRAATELIDNISKSETIAKLGASAAKKKIQAEVGKVTKAVEEEIAEKEHQNDISETPSEFNFKPLSLRGINKILTARELAPITPNNGAVESKVTPAKKQAIAYLDQLLEKIQLNPHDDGESYSITGQVGINFINEVSSFLKLNRDSAISTVKEERYIDDELAYYDENCHDGEVFIQNGFETFVSFNTDLAEEYPGLKLTVETENSVSFIKIADRTQLNSVIKKLNSKGINVLTVTQTRFNLDNNGKVSANTDADLLSDIPAVEEEENEEETEKDITDEMIESARADITPQTINLPNEAPALLPDPSESKRTPAINFDALSSELNTDQTLIDTDYDVEIDFGEESEEEIPY